MNVVILLYEGVTALDAVGPYEVLSLVPGATVQFAAAEAGPVRTDSGFLTLHADYPLADVSQPDVIVVPGSATHTPRAGPAPGQEGEHTLGRARIPPGARRGACGRKGGRAGQDHHSRGRVRGD